MTTKTRRRRPWILLSLFAIALALSALGVFPVRSAIAARMNDLKRYIAEEIERGYGLTVSYDSISPSILRSLELRGLVVSSDASGRVLLSARRVSVYYRIDKLLFGKPDESLREVRLSGVVADIDLERDARSIEALKGLFSASNGKKAALNFDLPLKIECRDLSARLGGAQGMVSLEKVQASILLGPGGINAQLSARAAYAASKVSRLPDFSVDFQAEGRSDIGLENARFLASVSGGTDSLRISTQKLIVNLESGAVELQKVPDRSPLDASARIDLASLRYSASLKMDGYRPSDLLGLSGGFSSLQPWLEGRGSGSFDISGSLNDKTCEYRMEGGFILPQRIYPEGGSFALDAEGDQKAVRVRSLRAEDGYGSGEFAGDVELANFLPSGKLSLVYRKAGLELSGDFALRREKGEMNAFSENASFAGTRLLSLSLDAKPVSAGLEFDLGCYLGQEGDGAAKQAEFSQEATGEYQAPRIQANGSINLSAKAFAEMSLYLTRVPSAFVYGAAASFIKLPEGDIRSFASDFTMNAEAFISTDFRKFSYNLPQVLLSYDKKEGNYGVLSISGSSSSFEASKILFFWDGYNFSGRLGAEIPQNGPMRFSSAFKLDEVPYQLSGILDPSKDFTLSGDYGFTLDGSFEGADVYFSLGMKDMPLPLASFTPRLTLNALGRFRNLEDWELNLNSSSLEQTGGFLPSYARISFDGSFRPSGGSLDTITLQDSFSELRGRADFSYSYAGEPEIGVKASLASRGAESYTADLLLKKESISGSLSVAQAPLARLSPKSPGGLLSLDAALSGSLRDPKIDFSGSLSQAVFYSNILNAKATGSFGGGRLDLSDFSCGYFIFALSGGKGSYRLDDSSLEFKSDLSVKLGDQARLETALDGKGTVMKGGAFSPAISGSLADISLGPVRISSWPYVVSAKEGDVSLNVGKDRYLIADMDAEGNFSLMLDNPLAVRGIADGRVTKDRIDATARNVVVDFPVIWKIFGNKIVDFPSGTVNADLTVSGSLTDPDFRGTGRASNFVCRVPDFLKDSFGPVGTDLKVDSKDIQASPFRVASSSGKGSADIGLSIQLDGWIPSIVDFRARTVKNDPVKAAAKINGFDIIGNADADIAIGVSPIETDLSGSIFLQDASIVMPWFTKSPDGAYGDMNIKTNVKIGIGKKVEFLSPSKDFPILKTYLEPSSSLVVGYDSGNGSYSMKGNTKIRGGEVFYLKRNFYLREGNILFNENESFFDPIVNLKAEVRDRDSLGDVTITMKVENSRLSQLKPRFESTPPRSESQILALLGIPEQGNGQAVLASADWGNVSKSLLSGTSDVLSQFYGVRLFENTVRDTFGLDMFSFRTQVIQKLLLGAVDNTPSLGEYLDNTTLVAGKYIGSDLFFQTMMQLRQNDSSNLKLNSEFSMEWNTPYFKLLWQLQPQHLEDLLVTDQSIGIYWSFSY